MTAHRSMGKDVILLGEVEAASRCGLQRRLIQRFRNLSILAGSAKAEHPSGNSLPVARPKRQILGEYF